MSKPRLRSVGPQNGTQPRQKPHASSYSTQPSDLHACPGCGTSSNLPADATRSRRTVG